MTNAVLLSTLAVIIPSAALSEAFQVENLLLDKPAFLHGARISGPLPPMRDPISTRSLQDTHHCDYIANALGSVFPGAARHSCSTCSGSWGKCQSEFSERCESYTCGHQVNCLEEDPGTVLDVCVIHSIETSWSVTISGGDEFHAQEISRTLVNTYTRGVVNIKQARGVSTFDANGVAVQCALVLDGQTCNSCRFCSDTETQESGQGVSIRRLDCSNFAPEAVDQNCEIDANVMDQLLILSREESGCFPDFHIDWWNLLGLLPLSGFLFWM